jgi:hypothetical protein
MDTTALTKAQLADVSNIQTVSQAKNALSGQNRGF